MAVILITHDLTVVRQFSDYVYVMQHGEVRSTTPPRQLFANPQHPYTQHLLASEPQGRGQPARRTAPASILEGERRRASPSRCKRGGFFKPDFFELVAVDNLDLDASPPRDAGPRRRIRLGQDHLRPGAAPPHRQPAAARSIFDGQPIHGQDRAARCGRCARACRSSSRTRSPRSTRACRSGQIIEEGLIVNSIGANGRERLDRVREALRRCRHARQYPVALPARILRRPAPAHRHRPRHRARARIHPARRADLGARPLGAGADHRPAAQAAGRAAASAISSSRTTSRSCARSATASSSCRTARSSKQGPVDEVLTNPKTAYTERLVSAAFEVA